nr:PREDICTED: syntaphilin [Apteryx mantelli mantelli]
MDDPLEIRGSEQGAVAALVAAAGSTGSSRLQRRMPRLSIRCHKWSWFRPIGASWPKRWQCRYGRSPRDTGFGARRPTKYNLCSDNHGIKPPTPEQYLTPLQQKEVCIRHLKARLKDTQERLQDRDAEIEDLKTQLSRMQEDWIEEECHRVEAQLALKEARKEIKQLKQVIDTVKNNLMEKDKGLQKYFRDGDLPLP